MITSSRTEAGPSTTTCTSTTKFTSSIPSPSPIASISISPIVNDLLQAMQMRLTGTSVRKVLVLFQSWSALFHLLDHSYTTTAPPGGAAATAAGAHVHVRGVPAVWQHLEGLQHTHHDLVVLLEELVCLLDRVGVRARGGGGGEQGGHSEEQPPTLSSLSPAPAPAPVVTADLSWASIRQHYTALPVSVELRRPAPYPSSSSSSDTDTERVTDQEQGQDEDLPVDIAAVDLLSLAQHLLQEVHSWTHQLVVTLATHPRPVALLGVLTLDFSPPEEESQGDGEGKGGGARGDVRREGTSTYLTLNLRSEYVMRCSTCRPCRLTGPVWTRLTAVLAACSALSASCSALPYCDETRLHLTARSLIRYTSHYPFTILCLLCPVCLVFSVQHADHLGSHYLPSPPLSFPFLRHQPAQKEAPTHRDSRTRPPVVDV